MACGFKTACPEERELLVLSSRSVQRKGVVLVFSNSPVSKQGGFSCVVSQPVSRETVATVSQCHAT